MVGRPKGSGRIHSDSNFRLPTGNNVVSRDSLWKFIKTISQADKYFTKEDLSTLGLYTRRADKIRCNLAYLKYLGVIEETRERVDKEGKDGRQQKFKVVETSNVEELISKIRSGDESGAKTQWKRLLADHPIWQHLQVQFFKGNPVKTTLELQHFLKNEIPRKTAAYMNGDSNYVNNSFHSSGWPDAHELPQPALPQDSWMPEPPEFGGDVNNSESQGLRKQSSQDAVSATAVKTSGEGAPSPISSKYYTIRINGPHINTSIELKSREQLRIIDVILESVRASLK